MRVPLGDLGVSPVNRNLSGTHVHKLGRRIVSVEGFVRWRYNHGWTHEPNPEDPLEVARNTNKVARATKLLPEVPMVPLEGSIAKTHLMTFLQCLKSGRMYWADDKRQMLCPAGHLLLEDHLKYGMFYEVFKWEAVQNDRASLVALCKSDNLDSAFALGETELQLLQAIKENVTVIRPPVGKTQWDVILDLVLKQCAQRWTEEDVCSIYNLSKVIGETHLEFLMGVVAPHVDWDVQAIRTNDFYLASRVSAALPWLKTALITAQYMAPDAQVDQGPVGKKFLRYVKKEQWERLGAAPGGKGTPLAQVEIFLQYLATMYMKSGSTEGGQVEVEIPAAFVRSVKAVILTKDLDQDKVDIGKVEENFEQDWRQQSCRHPSQLRRREKRGLRSLGKAARRRL